jgi:hypothetical protein
MTPSIELQVAGWRHKKVFRVIVAGLWEPLRQTDRLRDHAAELHPVSAA